MPASYISGGQKKSIFQTFSNFSPKRSFCALIVAGSLAGGCGSTSDLFPPGVPSGGALASYYQNDFSVFERMQGLTERDALIVGISYVDEKCSNFFDSIEQAHRYTVVAQSGLATSATQIASLMSVAKKSALSIASVAAAVEITKVLLEQYEKEFTFAPHAVELRALVQASMNAQRREYGLLIEADRIRSMVEVTSAVKKYAENCTLAAIREKWNQAVAKAVAEGVRPESQTSAKLLPPPQSGPAESSNLRRGYSGQGNVGSVLGVNKYVVR